MEIVHQPNDASALLIYRIAVLAVVYTITIGKCNLLYSVNRG